MAVRHDHNHGLGFSVGDQIIQDDVGPASPGPRSFDLPVAMQEIEDRILLSASLITWRRIHVDHSRGAEVLGLVEVHMDRSVRHWPLLEYRLLGTRNSENAGRSPSSQFQVWIYASAYTVIK